MFNTEKMNRHIIALSFALCEVYFCELISAGVPTPPVFSPPPAFPPPAMKVYDTLTLRLCIIQTNTQTQPDCMNGVICSYEC